MGDTNVTKKRRGILPIADWLQWTQKNLFSNWYNSIITIFFLYAFYAIVPPLFQWGIIDANFIGDSREACERKGACWVFIAVWFKRFLFGLYPNEELWRIYLCMGILAGLVTSGFIVQRKYRRYIYLALLLFIPFIVFPLIGGMSLLGLTKIDTRVWGGVFLTVVISTSALIICFPLGVLLALGRRSELPVVRYFCITFIEFWRGVPLISVLFMAAVMFPLFLPNGVTVDKLIRCIFGIALFEAAYMAEVVRGGLQAIPKKQYEVASALGLNYVQKYRLVILPQALTHVLPGIANTFIALVKDTPLVSIIGLFDLLGMMQLASNNTNWQGFSLEGYIFVAAIFWIFCFTMSRYTQKLEGKLSSEKK